MFQGLFKFIGGLIRFVFFLVIFIVIFHTWVIKQALTFSLSYQLGADVSIQSVKMDWKNTGFEVQGLEIGNPYSFPRGTLADIPLVIVSVDVPSLTKGKLRLKTVGFDLRELQVMNAAQKGLNVLALKPMHKADENPAGDSATREAVRRQIRKYTPELMIEELIFSIGDISYLDMSGPSLKQNKFHAGIRGATYYNIRGADDITAIVVAEAMKKMGFGYLQTQFQGYAKKTSLLGKLMEALRGGASY